MKVFVAGATGVVGRRIVPELVARGHEVVGATRTPGKAALLRDLGAEPVAPSPTSASSSAARGRGREAYSTRCAPYAQAAYAS